MNKAFDTFLWENYPKTETPLGKNLLNKVNTAVDIIDNRVISHDTTKFNVSEAQLLVKNVTLNEENGVLTITYYNGTSTTYSSLLGKLAVNFDFNEETQKIMIRLSNGEQKEVDLSAFITEYEFVNTGTIGFQTSADGKVSAIVKEGSIQEKHLRPDYLADVRLEQGKAQSSAGKSEEFAKLSESFAHGGTGMRENEDADNAMEYARQAKESAIKAEEISGKDFIPKTEKGAAGGVATLDGEGKVPESQLPSIGSVTGGVTGVKGNEESSYREGNVNITPENIGSPSNKYISEHFVPDYISSKKDIKFVTPERGWHRIASCKIYGYNSCVISLNRDNAYPGPEYQKIQLLNVYNQRKFVSLSALSYEHVWTRIREVREDSTNKAYIDIYQERNISGNACTISIEGANGVMGANWEVIEPVRVDETVEGETVFASLDLPANFDLDYLAKKDGSNVSGTWENLTVGSAAKATQDGDGNPIAETYALKRFYGDTVVSVGRKEGSGIGGNSFAFGVDVEATGEQSHAEGEATRAFALGSHVEGYGGVASENASYSHVEGHNTGANGRYAHAEGQLSSASGWSSHAEGLSTKASANYSHAEGDSTQASGTSSHAEGLSTKASGLNSHAEGYATQASDGSSHAEGAYTLATNYASHASGKYNKLMTSGGSASTQVGDAFVIGNGTSMSARSNALRVTCAGDILGTKAFQSSGADYAEFIKPWADGNPYNEDRVGYFVTVKSGLLYKAEEGDYIAGITSGNPSVVGNADEDYYWRYERDEFNRIVMEDVPETIEATDDEGNPLYDKETHEPVMIETGIIIPNARMKLSKDYDPYLQNTYIPRADRLEWDYVGMIGVIPVRDDGTCSPGQFCKCGQGGIATFATERGVDTFMVLERVSNNIISVIMK